MRKPTIKYARVEGDNKLIIVPTKEGESFLSELEDGIDEIGGTKIKAKVKIFSGATIKTFKEQLILPQNTHSFYVFTSNSQKWHLGVDAFVEVAKEEPVKK